MRLGGEEQRGPAQPQRRHDAKLRRKKGMKRLFGEEIAWRGDCLRLLFLPRNLKAAPEGSEIEGGVQLQK